MNEIIFFKCTNFDSRFVCFHVKIVNINPPARRTKGTQMPGFSVSKKTKKNNNTINRISKWNERVTSYVKASANCDCWYGWDVLAVFEGTAADLLRVLAFSLSLASKYHTVIA